MIQKLLGSRLFQTSSVYTFFNILNAAIPFFLIPVLTRYLPPEEYGVMGLFMRFLLLITPLVGLSTQGTVSVKFFQLSKEDLAGYIGNCLIWLLISMAGLGVGIFLFGTQLSDLFEFPTAWMYGAMIATGGSFITQLMLSVWQGKVQPWRYGIFQITQTLINFVLSLFLVVVVGESWQGRAESHIVTAFGFGLLSLVLLQIGGWIRWQYRSEYFKDAMKFGLPLIPHNLGGFFISYTDSLFITHMAGLTDMGLYTVGFQVGYIIEIATSSFNRAYVPWLYKRLQENDERMKFRIVRFTYFYFLAVSVIAVILSLLVPYFLRFFVGKDFQAAGAFTVWVAIGFAFQGMYYMVTNYIFFVNKNHILAGVTVTTAILNIILNYIFIQWHGAIGAVQASAIAYGVNFLLTWALSARVYPMPWNFAKVFHETKDQIRR